MQLRLTLVLLSLLLAACTSVTTPLPTSSMTATATPLPVETSTSPPPTATASAIPSPWPEMSPSPRPTINVVMTPDAVQVERWKEYEDALGKAILKLKVVEPFLCEWEILGRSAQETYVWAVCTTIPLIGNSDLYYSGSMPAVIHIGADGTVQSVEIPTHGGARYGEDIRQMFPPDVQERYFNKLINIQALTDHLHWRQEHPEEPPLIVLSATSMP